MVIVTGYTLFVTPQYDAIIWRHIHVCKPTFWRSLLTHIILHALSSVAVLKRGDAGWAISSPLLGPPSFLLNFTSSSFDSHIQQITFTQIILNDLKTFWRRFWQYSQAYVEFDRFNHSKSIFITTENHHAGETFMLPPLFFPWPRSGPLSFFILKLPLTFLTRCCTMCHCNERKLYQRSKLRDRSKTQHSTLRQCSS